MKDEGGSKGPNGLRVPRRVGGTAKYAKYAKRKDDHAENAEKAGKENLSEGNEGNGESSGCGPREAPKRRLMVESGVLRAGAANEVYSSDKQDDATAFRVAGSYGVGKTQLSPLFLARMLLPLAAGVCVNKITTPEQPESAGNAGLYNVHPFRMR